MIQSDLCRNVFGSSRFVVRRMLAKLFTYSLFGIEAQPVEVEVDISPGALPKTILVGLAEAAVKESTHRIERALVNSGYTRPVDRIVINLSPADLPKEAASFDLPIALGLLRASGQLQSSRFESYGATGELALDGTVRPTKGSCRWPWPRAAGNAGLLVPAANAQEAAVVEGLDVIAVGSLAEAVGFYTEQLDIPPTRFQWETARATSATTDSIMPTSKARRWPSGPSPSPPPARIIC